MFQVRDPLVQRRGDLPVAALYLCELPSQVAGRRTDLLAVVPLQGSVVAAACDRPQGRDLVRDLLLHPGQVRGLTADRLRISRYRIGVIAKRRSVGRATSLHPIRRNDHACAQLITTCYQCGNRLSRSTRAPVAPALATLAGKFSREVTPAGR